MIIHVVRHQYPLHCGGIHLSDQAVIHLMVLTMAGIVVLCVALATGKRNPRTPVR